MIFGPNPETGIDFLGSRLEFRFFLRNPGIEKWPGSRTRPGADPWFQGGYFFSPFLETIRNAALRDEKHAAQGRSGTWELTKVFVYRDFINPIYIVSTIEKAP